MKDHRGFSLVELIVVIAIMAVLLGVLAPSLLKYVEKSRRQKDISQMEEVTQAIRNVLAEEKVYDEVTGAMGQETELVFSFAPKKAEGLDRKQVRLSEAISGTDFPELYAGVMATINSDVLILSQTHGTMVYQVKITMTPGGAVTVKGSWVEDPSSAPSN